MTGSRYEGLSIIDAQRGKKASMPYANSEGPDEVRIRASWPSCSKRRQLNELVKGHFVNCFSESNIKYSDIFC